MQFGQDSDTLNVPAIWAILWYLWDILDSRRERNRFNNTIANV